MSRAKTVALVLACALAMAGCGDDGGGGKETITFWDNNGGPARTPVFQHLIAQFEQANPDVHVEYVGIPSSSVQQKYDTAIAGGATPDVGGITTSGEILMGGSSAGQGTAHKNADNISRQAL